MTKSTGRLRSPRGERGQVLPLAAVGLAFFLVAAAGLTIDVGSWLQAKRHAQAVADAAVLAAVQALPAQGDAAALAQSYATQNGGTIDPPQVSAAGDTVSVTARSTANTYFARVVGIGNISVSASAAARMYGIASLANVVPIAISQNEPALSCGGRPCFGQQTTLVFGKIDGVGGGFGLLDFTNSNGNVPPSTLADWIANGYPGELPIGQYQSPGNRYNAAAVRQALIALGARRPVVLVPIYSDYAGSGNNGNFTIAGFGAFRVASWDDAANSLTGSFVQVIEHGAHARGTNMRYFGVSQVALVG